MGGSPQKQAGWEWGVIPEIPASFFSFGVKGRRVGELVEERGFFGGVFSPIPKKNIYMSKSPMSSDFGLRKGSIQSSPALYSSLII